MLIVATTVLDEVLRTLIPPCEPATKSSLAVASSARESGAATTVTAAGAVEQPDWVVALQVAPLKWSTWAL